MNIFRRFINRFAKADEFPAEFEQWEDVVFNRKNIEFRDRKQRKDYVVGCLEQIKDAQTEIDNLQQEYNIVTAQLKDMEEIEALPAEEAQALKDAAMRLSEVSQSRASHELKSVPMDEGAYQRMEALSDQVETGIEKLKDAEEYHKKIKMDLKRLSGEKEAYAFRKSELTHMMEDLRSVMVVCLSATVFCVVLLLVLHLGFSMDVRIGYLLTTGLCAIAITVIFIKYGDAKKDLRRMERSVNKLILLHNSVKIRYVNNSNLLEYLRLKYRVSNAAELKKLHAKYLEEKKRREAFKQLERELQAAERDLVRILRHAQISDPLIWIHQVAAILDKREMVEVRHNLIIRRQSLRKRVDYNKEVVAKKAQDEIRELVEDYPAYAAEIRDMVADYEGKYS